MQGGPLLIATRAVFVGALLSTGGVLTFRALVMPHVQSRIPADALQTTDRALTKLAWISLAIAALGCPAWTLLQTADLAGADRVGAALWPVLSSTRFGHLILLQAGLIAIVAALLLAGAPRPAAVAAMALVAAQAAHGHAMAMGGLSTFLFWSGVLHLLAAAAWIGGLLPLLLVVRLAPFNAACLAARWFSPLGQWCVVVLLGSALIQAWRLVATWSALLQTPYGWTALAKTLCFGVLFALAVLNRYSLAPALRGDRPGSARTGLTTSIAVQTAAGALAILASALLSALTPGMDMGEGAQ